MINTVPGKSHLKNLMPRGGLPICSIQLPATLLPRQGLPIR